MVEGANRPLVSVVMTVRNVEDYISETLASILQEREVPLEVILVDNGCTDSTIERVLAFNDDRVRILEGPRKGIAHALNVAYAAVRGEIIMRCDGDDLFPPDRIARQSQWLRQNPEFGAVCGAFSTIDPKSKRLADLASDQEARDITDQLCNGITETHIGTFAIRTDVVKAAGGSREYFDCFEDVDFMLRVGETCRVWFAPEIDYLYRLRNSSVVHSTGKTKMIFYDKTAIEFQKQRRTRGQDDLQLGHPPVVPETADLYSAEEHRLDMLLAGAWTEHEQGRKGAAIAKGLAAAISQPTNLELWRNLLFLTIKPAGRPVDA